jgi:hypothetical protein
MSLRVLVLDTLHLANLEHHLKLSVVSAAEVKIPQNISNLEDAALLKTLTSGNLWVTRGIACHLDIQVLFNGKPLGRGSRANMLESLGQRLRDAQVRGNLLFFAGFCSPRIALVSTFAVSFS